MTVEKKACASCGKTPKWKQDFPIEWEGDHYVTRREMVKFMTLGSLLLAAANWIAAIAGSLLHRGSHAERHIGAASALEQTGSLLFRYPTDADPCIAVRTPEGKLVAYSRSVRISPAPLCTARVRTLWFVRVTTAYSTSTVGARLPARPLGHSLG